MFIEHYSAYEKLDEIPKGQITLSKVKINDKLQNIQNVWDVSEKTTQFGRALGQRVMSFKCNLTAIHTH